MRRRRRGNRGGEPSVEGGVPGTPPVPVGPVEAAIRWIGGRRRFEREVRGFLRREGLATPRADETVERLRELGLVSDEETSRAFLRDRLRFAPKGRRLLLGELLARGTPAGVAEAALQEVVTEDAEHEAAADFLRRSARKWRELPEGLARHRAGAALARRGFSPDVARQALTRVLGESKGEDLAIHEEVAGPGEP